MDSGDRERDGDEGGRGVFEFREDGVPEEGDIWLKGGSAVAVIGGSALVTIPDPIPRGFGVALLALGMAGGVYSERERVEQAVAGVDEGWGRVQEWWRNVGR